MKRFLSAVGLCVGLLFIFGLSFLLPQSEAQNNVLQSLLDLPAPPPPNPLFPFRNANAMREAAFYNKLKPPADDAPIEDLLEYWEMQSRNYRELGYNINPSEKSLERILEEIEENPNDLTKYINSLPRTERVIEFIKKLYDEKSADKPEDSDEEEDYFSSMWRERVKEWLTNNSKYFSDDLLEVAQQVEETEEYVTNQDELLALARVDWDKARPIVERLYNDKTKKVSQVLGIWAMYVHALETDSIDISKYRDELKAVVEDKNATPGMRDLALDALVKEKEWDGRDEWYLSLLEDETLGELRIDGRVFTGLTTIIYHAPPDRFVEKMLELLKSDNPAVRTAAVRNLSVMLSPENIEVVRALLPWLSDAKWAKEVNDERRTLIEALQKIQMQESVPGLISLLNEKSTVTINTTNTLSNSAKFNFQSTNETAVTQPTPPIVPANTMPANTASQRTVEVYRYRFEAVQALVTQKDTRAVPALRVILSQVEGWERGNVVQAIFASRGFSVNEQIEALEFIIKEAIKNSNANFSVNAVSNTANVAPLIYYSGNTVGNYTPIYRADPNDIRTILGNLLINSSLEPDADLVRTLIARINELDRKDPPLAQALRGIVKSWKGAAVNSLFLAELKSGKADLDTVVKLLAVRKELREKQPDEVFGLRGSNQIANGIMACILENPSDYEGILAGENIDAKIALLGCARLIRAQLPFQKVAELAKSPNKMLATAAMRWLEAEDSPQTRQIILANNPNKAKVLGARMSFTSDETEPSSSNFLPLLFQSVNTVFLPYFTENSGVELKLTEKRLREEVTKKPELLGIYAYDSNFVRIYKDKIVFSWEEDEARYNERNLTAQEFDELKEFLISQNVETLKPFLSVCYSCVEKELLMLGAQGGQRIYLRSDRTPPFFARLDKYFAELRKQQANLRYYLEDDITGLEILFTDPDLKALNVWKRGNDFRVLISDTKRFKQIEKELDLQDEADAQQENIDYEKLEQESRKRRELREFEHLSWQIFKGNTLSGLTNQPPQNDVIPVRDNFSAQATNEQWKARTENIEVRDGDDDLIKIVGGQSSKIADGYFMNPVVTGNGRWAVLTKYDDDTDSLLLIRVNLANNRQYKVEIKDAPLMRPVVFIAAHNKILLGQGGLYDSPLNAAGKFYLLDAETGAAQPVKGEIRPLIQQTFRPLQPTGTPDEYWAAIPDEEKSETQIGIYNTKNFSFKPLMTVPRIKLDSMQIWADEGKIYFTYEGHLLALPMPKLN